MMRVSQHCPETYLDDVDDKNHQYLPKVCFEMIWQRDHVFCFARMLGSRNLRGVAMLVAMR